MDSCSRLEARSFLAGGLFTCRRVGICSTLLPSGAPTQGLSAMAKRNYLVEGLSVPVNPRCTRS